MAQCELIAAIGCPNEFVTDKLSERKTRSDWAAGNHANTIRYIILVHAPEAVTVAASATHT